VKVKVATRDVEGSCWAATWEAANEHMHTGLAHRFGYPLAADHVFDGFDLGR